MRRIRRDYQNPSPNANHLLNIITTGSGLGTYQGRPPSPKGLCDTFRLPRGGGGAQKHQYLVIGPPISYNRGILAYKIMILGFSNKRGGKDNQHEMQIFIHR